MMCRRFADQWYTTKFERGIMADYSSTVPPTMTAEKKLVYEVSVLLWTHVDDVERKAFDIDYVSSVKDNTTTALWREVL